MNGRKRIEYDVAIKLLFSTNSADGDQLHANGEKERKSNAISKPFVWCKRIRKDGRDEQEAGDSILPEGERVG